MHPVYETVSSPSNWPAGYNKLRPEQVLQRSTWSRTPDDPHTALGGVHAITQMPNVHGSTTTILNPLDPGTVDDITDADTGTAWLDRPGGLQIAATRAGRR